MPTRAPITCDFGDCRKTATHVVTIRGTFTIETRPMCRLHADPDKRNGYAAARPGATLEWLTP